MRLFSEQRGAIYRANIRGAVYSQREHVELVQISPMEGSEMYPFSGIFGTFSITRSIPFCGIVVRDGFMLCRKLFKSCGAAVGGFGRPWGTPWKGLAR